MTSSPSRRHPPLPLTPSSQKEHPLCFICISPILHHALGTCSCSESHLLCATCALRNRLFVQRRDNKEREKDKDKDNERERGWTCLNCQQVWSSVFFSAEMRQRSDHDDLLHVKIWSDANVKHWTFDKTIGVHFQDEKTMKQFAKLRSIYCPICEEQTPSSSSSSSTSSKSTSSALNETHQSATRYFSTMQGLNKHLQHQHQLFTCEACITTRQVFIHEHEFFTQTTLRYHFQHGSRAAQFHGPIDPHPFCQYCNQPFFSSDELYAHLSNEHRTCRFCQREGYQKWFRHDAALKRHFLKHHYFCEQGSCSCKPPDYAAFVDANSLRTHQLAAHVDKSQLSQAQLKQLARVDLNLGQSDPRLPTHSSSQTSSAAGIHDRREERRARGDQHMPNYIVDDEDDVRIDFRDEEQFPVLQSSSIEQRARAANENIQQRSKQDRPAHASSSSCVSGISVIPHSYSQPQLMRGARSFDQEEFPSLPGPAPACTVSPCPLPPSLSVTSSSRPASSRSSNSNFDSSTLPVSINVSSSNTNLRALKERVQSDKLAGPSPSVPVVAKNSKYTQPASSLFAHPSSSSVISSNSGSLLSSMDQRSERNSDSPRAPKNDVLVPLPLPGKVLAYELGARNNALISALTVRLKQPESTFEEFRKQSGAYRSGLINAGEFLQYFYRVFAHADDPEIVEKLLIELIALLPDEDKRGALYSEYAKRKMMNTSDLVKTHNHAPSTFSAANACQTARLEEQAEEKQRNAELALKKEQDLQKRREERRHAEQQAKLDKQQRLRAERDKRKQAEAEQALREADRLMQISGELHEENSDEKTEDEEELHRRMEDERIAAEQQERDNLLRFRALELETKQADSRAKAHLQSTVKLATNLAKSKSFPVLVTDQDENPALPSSFSSSLENSLPDPSELDQYLSNINELTDSLPNAMLIPLRFLSTLLLSLTVHITKKHAPSVIAPANRRFWATDEARARLHSLASKVRFNHALEFSRLAQIGLMPSSVQGLSGAVSMFRRFDDADMMHDWLSGVMRDMKPNELFLLYEYVHALLSAMTSSEHEEVSEALERAIKSDNSVQSDQDGRTLVMLQPKNKEQESIPLQHSKVKKKNNKGAKVILNMSQLGL